MNKVDFLPEDYIERRKQRRINAICLALFLLVVAGVAGGFVVTERRRADLEMYTAKLEERVEKAQVSLKQYEAVQARKKQILAKAKTSVGLISPVPQSLVLALITNRLPEQAALVDYKMETKELRTAVATAEKKGDKKAGKKPRKTADACSAKDKSAAAKAAVPEPPKLMTAIEVIGLANSDLDVAQFVADLDRSTLLERVDLQYSKESQYEGRVMRRFKITAVVAPDTIVNSEEMARIRHASQEESPAQEQSFVAWLFGVNK